MKNNITLDDLVLKDGWVIDPSQSLNGRFDVAVRDGRIVAVAQQLPPYKAKQTFAANDYLICPGLIDLHVHVYEWVTNFGIPADDVGINAGVTTVVDQGSSSPFTFSGFKSKVVEKAQTDVRCFLLINHAATQTIGNIESGLEDPQKVDIKPLIQLAKDNPQIIRGFKVHADSGSISRWGMGVLKLAREVGDRTNLPLYVHTGELFPVVEAKRPNPETVVENALSYMKPGDILGHCYSCQPDGLMGTRTQVPAWLIAAIDKGILLDLGHGLKFSFDIARRMMAQGVFPHTISSDAHGNFKSLHDDSTLTYSLCGGISKLMALGLDLVDAIATVTINPARVLQAEAEIGTLKVGSLADITVLDLVQGDCVFCDSLGKQLIAKEKLVPVWVVRSGRLIQPHRSLLRDLENQYSDIATLTA
ncbi:amidohydrolase/deacetylase family metallohydrolase [Nostocaceae cyanobacterium CENA357]|uniref:Amidohydrolase/deacetylase family metallohydrolase n=1 Tax=Atlanticothrix silvestris CENA357 TaxID=1725252 RepID=A0A8J7HJE0_9CYAN|nr:amidohydrolase/deacetylase family metallohydrolase [Atlanticothrix silvestris]MBH8556317.1 amidohydrolase/deacetylase family metallohydrolase [Atlanticothrix silvestris CENA357]